MRFGLLCKRYYTNKDLLSERFGRLYHLPAELSRLGHKGLVLAADYRSDVTDVLETRGTVFYSLPSSVLNLFSFVAKTYRRFRSFCPDVLIASGDSHLGALGLLYARMLGIPFVFDIYDDYTTFESHKIPGMRKLFYYSVQKADLVVTASVPLCRRLREFNKAILTIENGTDLALFKPMDRESARGTLSVDKNKTVIGFFGSITRNRGVQTLIQAISILRSVYPNVLLLIAGRNSFKLELNKPYIDYRGMVPHEEVPRLINSCDVAVIPYLSDRQTEMTNACKIAEYQACGVPVVATRVSNNAEIFADAPQSICEPGDPEDMALAIRSQLESPQIARFPEGMTWQNLGERLSDVLEGLALSGSLSNAAPTKSC
jgi:glycosyltransferase involved in cell wall biosynthesis